MSEARPEAQAGGKPTLNSCCDAVQSKLDQALLKLSGLEQILKTTSPQPHHEKVYGAVSGVLNAMSSVDEATMLFEGMPEKEQPEVPCKLLEWLDAGNDPDAFYKHLIDDTIWGSQVMQGKISAMTRGRANLTQELKDVTEQVPHQA